jgi:uncharacterized RDD family membrane protein YckC
VPARELPFETASWARRILALLVDYAACWGVMLLIYGREWFGNGSVPSIYLNLLFVGESAVLMALSGGSFGQLATRLRVVRVDGSGRPLGLLPSRRTRAARSRGRLGRRPAPAPIERCLIVTCSGFATLSPRIR